VNDVAMLGADPRFLTATFILEEGFAIHELELIIDSFADACREAGVAFRFGAQTGIARQVQHIAMSQARQIDRGIVCAVIVFRTNKVGICDPTFLSMKTTGAKYPRGPSSESTASDVLNPAGATTRAVWTRRADSLSSRSGTTSGSLPESTSIRSRPRVLSR